MIVQVLNRMLMAAELAALVVPAASRATNAQPHHDQAGSIAEITTHELIR